MKTWLLLLIMTFIFASCEKPQNAQIEVSDNSDEINKPIKDSEEYQEILEDAQTIQKMDLSYNMALRMPQELALSLVSCEYPFASLNCLKKTEGNIKNYTLVLEQLEKHLEKYPTDKERVEKSFKKYDMALGKIEKNIKNIKKFRSVCKRSEPIKKAISKALGKHCSLITQEDLNREKLELRLSSLDRNIDYLDTIIMSIAKGDHRICGSTSEEIQDLAGALKRALGKDCYFITIDDLSNYEYTDLLGDYVGVKAIKKDILGGLSYTLRYNDFLGLENIKSLILTSTNNTPINFEAIQLEVKEGEFKDYYPSHYLTNLTSLKIDNLDRLSFYSFTDISDYGKRQGFTTPSVLARFDKIEKMELSFSEAIKQRFLHSSDFELCSLVVKVDYGLKKLKLGNIEPLAHGYLNENKYECLGVVNDDLKLSFSNAP